MPNQKCGPHDIQGWPAGVGWARRSNITKSVGNPAAILAAPPHALRLFRWPFSEVEQSDLIQAADGRAFADRTIGALNGYHHPRLYLEGPNEPGPLTEDLMAFYRVFIPYCRERGYEPTGICSSSGAYDEVDFERMRRLGLRLWNVHAYWSVRYGPTTWNAWRWRRYWQPGDPPIVVSECGVDRVRDAPGGGYEPPEEGFANGYAAQGYSPEEMAESLLAYGASLTGTYEWGAVGFTTSPTDLWRDKGFDLDPCCERMAAEYEAWWPQAPPSPGGKTVFDFGLLYRMGEDIPEVTMEGVATLCRTGGITIISPKVKEADMWMAGPERWQDHDPVLGVDSLDTMIRQKATYSEMGIRYHPWAVYRGFDWRAEAEAHAEALNTVDALIIDFEWRYAGFADHGTWEDFVRYCQLLNDLQQPGHTLVFCPDPRQVIAHGYAFSEVAPYFEAFSDQSYWTDFQRSMQAVVDAAERIERHGLEWRPMFPANSTPADLRAALTDVATEDEGVPAPRTIYLFQRVGLKQANLAVTKSFAAESAPTGPSSEVMALWDRAYVLKDDCWNEGRQELGDDIDAAYRADKARFGL